MTPVNGHDVDAAVARAPWRRFVAIGDSITEGYGMDAVDGVESIPWAERVASALRAGHEEFTFVNLAYRSLVARQIRELQLDRALELEPDLVAIAAGPNDLLEVDFAYLLAFAVQWPTFGRRPAGASRVAAPCSIASRN